jgi:hypothetical protein
MAAMAGRINVRQDTSRLSIMETIASVTNPDGRTITTTTITLIITCSIIDQTLVLV